MSKPFTKHIAFLLFVMLMTNLGVWGFSANRLAHELEHNGMAQAASSHQHAHQHAGNAIHDDDDDDDPPGASQHRVLHAVDHLQFFPGTAFGGAFVAAVASATQMRFTEQSLPLPTFDPPFRPPRGGATTA